MWHSVMQTLWEPAVDHNDDSKLAHSCAARWIDSPRRGDAKKNRQRRKCQAAKPHFSCQRAPPGASEFLPKSASSRVIRGSDSLKNLKNSQKMS
jgi:hypothetical protein